jgi:predicted transcriptional regulator
MSTTSGRARGELERDVLVALAAASEPMTAQQVLAQVDPSLAYTTVMTTLTRLHAKGALVRTPLGRAYAYELPGTREDAGDSMTAQRMLRLLDAGSDRAGVLARFVANLEPSDEAMLAELLANTNTNSGAAPAPRSKRGR